MQLRLTQVGIMLMLTHDITETYGYKDIYVIAVTPLFNSNSIYNWQHILQRLHEKNYFNYLPGKCADCIIL